MTRAYDNRTTITLARQPTQADIELAHAIYDRDGQLEERSVMGHNIQLDGQRYLTDRESEPDAHQRLAAALRAAFPRCRVETVWTCLEPVAVHVTEPDDVTPSLRRYGNDPAATVSNATRDAYLLLDDETALYDRLGAYLLDEAADWQELRLLVERRQNELVAANAPRQSVADNNFIDNALHHVGAVFCLSGNDLTVYLANGDRVSRRQEFDDRRRAIIDAAEEVPR